MAKAKDAFLTDFFNDVFWDIFEMVSFAAICLQFYDCLFSEKDLDTAAVFAKRPDGKVHCLVKNCKKTISNMSHAKEHYVRMHQPRQNLKCDLCEDVLPNPYAMKRHVNRNHGISSRDMKNIVTVPAPKLVMSKRAKRSLDFCKSNEEYL